MSPTAMPGAPPSRAPATSAGTLSATRSTFEPEREIGAPAREQQASGGIGDRAQQPEHAQQLHEQDARSPLRSEGQGHEHRRDRREPEQNRRVHRRDQVGDPQEALAQAPGSSCTAQKVGYATRVTIGSPG
jgi:hypothetical protein